MNTSDPVILVVGATGFVGREIVEQLSGKQVTTMSGPRLTTSARTVAELLVEATRPPFELPKADVLINAAGLATPTAIETDELFGANALLPVSLARAAAEVGIRRFVHLSSAAVQGYTRTLTSTATWSAHSPYAASKALGEQALLALDAPGNVIHRATSVHGADRSVTRTLMSVARGPISSVAGTGRAPTPQVHVSQVAAAVAFLATTNEEPPPITLQPWGGHTVESLLATLGGHPPRHIPHTIARYISAAGRNPLVSRVRPGIAGQARRLDMLWFGQAQEDDWLSRRRPDLCERSPEWSHLGAVE